MSIQPEVPGKNMDKI